MSNTNDDIRDAILRHLYDLHRRARSPKVVGTMTRELQAAMKKFGISQSEFSSNLDYLVQKGWVREVVTPRSFVTPGGMTTQSEVRTYKISDVGIDKLEGASAYRREEHFSRINITNIRGVTIIGDGNVVNREFTDLSRALGELEDAVAESAELSSDQKLSLVADIGSLQSQLSKPVPNRDVIGILWNGVEKAVIAAGFVALAQRISDLILSL